MMEKLGVVLDDEKTKQAGGQKCPKCGFDLGLTHAIANPPRCPKCGSTEAFEKRPTK